MGEVAACGQRGAGADDRAHWCCFAFSLIVTVRRWRFRLRRFGVKEIVAQVGGRIDGGGMDFYRRVAAIKDTHGIADNIAVAVAGGDIE